MCCKNRIVVPVPMNASIISKNGADYQSPLSVDQFIASEDEGTYWKETNVFGQLILCGFLEEGSDCVLNYGTAQQPKLAEAFVFGGHPLPVRPHIS